MNKRRFHYFIRSQIGALPHGLLAIILFFLASPAAAQIFCFRDATLLPPYYYDYSRTGLQEILHLPLSLARLGISPPPAHPSSSFPATGPPSSQLLYTSLNFSASFTTPRDHSPHPSLLLLLLLSTTSTRSFPWTPRWLVELLEVVY